MKNVIYGPGYSPRNNTVYGPGYFPRNDVVYGPKPLTPSEIKEEGRKFGEKVRARIVKSIREEATKEIESFEFDLSNALLERY